MGQFAKDWEHLKTLIRQKDDAIDRQAAQIAALQKQVSAQAQQQLDADDQKAVAELRQTLGDNAPPAAPPKPAAASAPGAAPPSAQAGPATTFTK